MVHSLPTKWTSTTSHLWHIPDTSEIGCRHSRVNAFQEKWGKLDFVLVLSKVEPITSNAALYFFSCTLITHSQIEPALYANGLVSHKYTIVAVQIKIFTAIYTQWLTLGTFVCFHFPSSKSKLRGCATKNFWLGTRNFWLPIYPGARLNAVTADLSTV